MKHIVCSFVLCVSSIVWISCQRDNKIQRDQVDSIVFYAMPKGAERPVDLVSFQELKNGGKDSLITDTHFIRKFSRLANRLTPDANRESIDIRSAAVVKMKTGDSLVIAFGEKWGTVILNDLEGDNKICDSLGFRRVRGVYMKDNAELFRFIDKYVYGPHSNDYWLDDVTRGWVKYVRDILPEQLFARFPEESISTEFPYSIGNYKDYVFYISFGGNRYIGYMHPDSASFYRLGRYYTDAQIDSLHIRNGREPVIEYLPVDSALAADLAGLCVALKRLEASSSKRLFIEELTVDASHSIWFKTFCRGYDAPFLILITDDFHQALELSQEVDFKDDYKELGPSLYYRRINSSR